MNNDGNRMLAPNRRFPEFRDKPGWEQAPLSQLAERTTTKNLDGSVTRVMTNSAERGVIDQRDYFDKDIANSENIAGYYVVDLADYVYNPRISNLAPVGPISRNYLGKGVMSPLYTVFRFAHESTDFYSHYFKTSCWHSYLRQVASTGARHDRMSITTGDFMAMPVPTPSLSEQKKIADCISSLDELIAAEGHKLEVLKAHKKGLLEQLFPLPGETRPRRRFPEFKDSPEWETYSLIEIAKFRRGSFPQPYGLPEWYDDENGKPFVQVFDVDTNFRLKARTKNRISELAAEQSVFIPKGTLIVTLQGSIGRVAITQYDAYVDRTLLLFENFLKPLDKLFFAYVIHNLFDIEKRKASGEIIKTITKEVLSDFEVKLPSPPEQRKIADCSSSLEELIVAQSQKLDALRIHKKGLMQQLFPSPGEVDA